MDAVAAPAAAEALHASATYARFQVTCPSRTAVACQVTLQVELAAGVFLVACSACKRNFKVQVAEGDLPEEKKAATTPANFQLRDINPCFRAARSKKQGQSVAVFPASGGGWEESLHIGSLKTNLHVQVSFAVDSEALEQGACASGKPSAAIIGLGVTMPAGVRSVDMALALATLHPTRPFVSLLFARAGMMSADGRCKTFDARANGCVRGEGGGSAALCAEDAGLTLSGCAVRADCKSASLTAPNGTAQARMIGAALAAAGHVQLGVVEAHGTGTPLSDPTEGSGLERSLDVASPPCVGGVKADHRHIEPAAGLVGLLLALVQSSTRGVGLLYLRGGGPVNDGLGTAEV